MIQWIIASSCLILMILIIRRIFSGKISARLQYALWLLVVVRLLIPINLGNSVLSIENFTNQLRMQKYQEENFEQIEFSENTYESTDRIKVFDSIEEITVSDHTNIQLDEISTVPVEEKDLEVDIFAVLFEVWLLGAGAAAMTFFISNIVFGKRLKTSRTLIDSLEEKVPVYVSSAVETPCLFGVIRPGIYVTNDVAEDKNTLRHAVVHEITHYEQGDMVWAVLRCVCLSLHWYNPLVWWAAKLSKLDAELACDEATIRKLGEDERLAYGKTLIQLTCEKRQDLFVTATTMTSDKKSITERIQRIAKKSKLTIYALVGVFLISVLALGCTFTGANEKNVTDAPVRGVPFENPEENGWDLSNVEDVREYFHRMSLEPEEGSINAVYLLGETNQEFRLYGKGDYQTMLLEMNGKYAEIDFPYASNYMELPRLIDNDIDHDGKLELCIVLWLQHGSGLHIENLLLADFDENGQLYVYEFVQEEYTEQLQEVLSYEIAEEGIQPFVNGQTAGRMEPHLVDMEPFDGASVGNQMRFDCDPLTGELRLRGDIMLLIKKHPGGIFGNGNDVTATVCWDGEKFSLTNFTSNICWLEEQNKHTLQNQDDAASKANKIIEKVNANLREGYVDAKLTYVDNAEVGWNFYSDNPWSTDAERDTLAQAALKELYTLTGYNVTECTYTTDGRSRFIFGKSGDYIRKCIAFYSRDFGFILCGDSIPYQGYMNARKFHYSDVQQLDSPYGKNEYSDLKSYATWYLEHSGVYQGETITHYEEINLDDTVYTHIKLIFDGGYYIVVMNESIEAVSEIMGPYYESRHKSELTEQREFTYYKEAQKDQVCLAVMPDGVSKAGGDYRYIVPEDQEKWIKSYNEMYEVSSDHGRWQEDEHSMGIWIVYKDEWTCMTDQGFIVDFEKRTEVSDAQEFYELCLNEAKNHGINEPMRPEEMKNFVQATLALKDKMYLLTDEKSLFELQKVFSSSQEIRGGAGCPFTADLCFKTKEGEMINISLATDSCNTWLSSGVYYQYPGFEDLEELRSYFNEHGTDISSALDIYNGYNLAVSWANAFVNKDVETIVKFATEDVIEQLVEYELLDEERTSFGWSSPWPGLFTEESYQIISCDDQSAEILYYASLSTPHVVAWREILEFVNGQISSWDLQSYENISTIDDYKNAYPNNQITNTPMDYNANGLGQALNENALLSSSQAYKQLFDARTAALDLLNISRSFELEYYDVEETEDGTVVSIPFLNRDGSIERVTVTMWQPYGKDGIWIPKTN